MTMTRKLLLGFFLLLFKFSLADEGMWLPQLLAQLNEKQMKSLGMKISASDIYNVNKGSLKDAIVSFGGFCTGEVISDQGLVLTNHHCGFDAIQNNSTVERNYLKDGFWAYNKGQELRNPGLFVTFIVRIDDVTSAALKGVTAGMAERDRQALITQNIEALRPTVKKESYQDLLVRPFYEGNKYYLFVTETYKDVRLVGAPPSSIGNFGKDTDNWMWPRHTGDFSMFRIYASKDNKPAEYSADNVPYKPKRSLSISLGGVKENDFTMVFGFPGRTTEYLPSTAVEQIVTVNDPAKIHLRSVALKIMDEYMRSSDAARLQYAAKYANVENAYKKWQGEVLGINRTGALEKKRAYEAEFQKRVNANPKWKAQWGELLPQLNALYADFQPLGLARDYQAEVIGRIDIFNIATQLNLLSREKYGTEGFTRAAAATAEKLEELYKEYNADVDKRLFSALMEEWVKTLGDAGMVPELRSLLERNNNNYAKAADDLFKDSDLDENGKMLAAIKADPQAWVNKYQKDPAYLLFVSLGMNHANNFGSKIAPAQAKINALQREYMAAQMKVFKEKTFYPDANSTLRVAYGKVKGYEARDAVAYSYYTYLDGVMEKYKPGDYEFDLPQKLRDLYAKKDYGRYGTKGRLPVCFIATNHTTGGNSGSPVLNANGHLIGLNFDRVWEGTMSDLNYDPSICRNIMVDARYVLFIIDKYAGATNLIQEMKLVP